MKKTFKSWWLDIQSIRKSPLVLVTILIFCFIPLVYSLSMIYSSWDPYATKNMRRLPIAVINDDEGVYSNGKNLNIGNEIERDLKKNSKAGWVFVNEWQGNNGLNNGKYYALIQIPNDLSSKIVSVKTSNPQQATVTYQVNQKLNAAATKISSEIGNDLHEQLRKSLVHVETKLVINKMNTLAVKLQKAKPKLLKINQTLDSALAILKKEKNNILAVKSSQKKINNQLKRVPKNIKSLNENLGLLKESFTSASHISDKLSSNFSEIQNQLDNEFKDLKEQNIQFAKESSRSRASLNKKEIGKLKETNLRIRTQLNTLAQFINEISIVVPSNQIKSIQRNIRTIKKRLAKQRKGLDIIAKENRKENSAIVTQMKNLNRNINDTQNLYASNIEKNIEALNNRLKKKTHVFSNNNTNINQIKKLINNLSSTGNNSDFDKQSASLIYQLDDASKKIKNLKSELGVVTGKNLDIVISILSSSPKTASILSNPIKLQSKNLYNMGLLGYSVTPFYTVLSIWVGILLCTTIISWDYTEFSRNKKLKLSMQQKYFGKLFLYGTISFIQTTLLLIGELVVLGIHPKFVFGFCLVTYFIAFTFTVIIFTLVYVFGNLGKVLSVLLMLIQIFGTGGMYPLEIIPKSLSSMGPFLPFYYAINALRDMVAGVNDSSFMFTIIILVEFILFFLLLALLRKMVHSLVFKFENGFKSSDL
ncbi:YhgE/Pip domain-containing protein [Levilactobacillus brevis]|uniref:YhgE/Pip domain-containing protein n=1 Tax=Levilactobacillus brevis TaxID=1580 RepID=UPI001BA4DB0C|nr:YhgE/Pip domain-containing protein [Levilactobacillus brevis]MBS0979017.1 YhgE/Pip domain-containing protein [Levilactobacillus brevis]